MGDGDEAPPTISPKTVLYVCAGVIVLVAAMCTGTILAIFT